MSTVPIIDARTVDKNNLQGASLSERDYAILTLLRLNDRDPITHLTYAHKLVYLAQVGGLHNSTIDLSDYDAIPDYFAFENGAHGPVSPELSHRLDTLVDLDLIESTTYPNPSGTGRISYALSDAGADILDNAPDALSMTELRTLKFVKTYYTQMPLLELIDRVQGDYNIRDLNDLF